MQYLRTMGGQRLLSTSVSIAGRRQKRTTSLGMAGGVISAAALSITALGVYKYESDEGFRRSVVFWSKAFPVYVHYRLTQNWVKNKPDPEQEVIYEKLHDRHAPTMLDVILTLRGFYIKIGQVGATRADFLPPQYIDRLSVLQDGCPSEEFESVKATIEHDLGRPMDEVFAYFDPKPIGSASIGQAHLARLKNGDQVVVKVQYPKVEGLFRGDVNNIRAFCELAQPAHLVLLDEIEKQFLTEFDYQKEAQHLERVGQNLARSPYRKMVAVPKPYLDLCTKKVLVMSYLPGVKFVDAIKKEYEHIAAERGMTLKELEKRHREEVAAGLVPALPSAKQIRTYSRYLKLKDAASNTWRFLFNHTAGYLGYQVPYVKTRLPINIPEIMDKLVAVHAHEIFVDGYFNGDPHPGNILLMPDGRLGLIDYGQVKQMDVASRRKLAKLIIALAEEDKEAIVRAMREMGFRSTKQDPYVAEKMAIIGFDRDGMDVTEGKNIQMFFEDLDARDKVISAADEYVMASRVSLLLRGLGTVLNYPMSTAKMWKPVAEKFLKDTDKVVLDEPRQQ